MRDAVIRFFRPEFLGDPDRDTPYRVSIDGKIVADLWSGHSGQRGIRGELRPDLEVEDALDILYGPLWLRLLVGHRPMGPASVDRLLSLAWPGLVNGASARREAGGSS